jgi:hypothetical protein
VEPELEVELVEYRQLVGAGTGQSDNWTVAVDRKSLEYIEAPADMSMNDCWSGMVVEGP